MIRLATMSAALVLIASAAFANQRAQDPQTNILNDRSYTAASANSAATAVNRQTTTATGIGGPSNALATGGRGGAANAPTNNANSVNLNQQGGWSAPAIAFGEAGSGGADCPTVGWSLLGTGGGPNGVGAGLFSIHRISPRCDHRMYATEIARLTGCPAAGLAYLASVEDDVKAIFPNADPNCPPQPPPIAIVTYHPHHLKPKIVKTTCPVGTHPGCVDDLPAKPLDQH